MIPRAAQVPASLAASLFLVIVPACGESAPGRRADGDAERASAAITRGAGDDADPSVVALVYDGVVRCTGTLVAPRVVLTAAHCVDDALELPGVFFGSAFTPGAETIATTSARVHPSFDRATLRADVAVLVLAAEPPPGVTPSPWAAPGALDHVPSSVRVVGFGATGTAADVIGQKRSGRADVVAVERDRFRLGDGGALTCGGDSGGPAFVTIDGVDVVAGVTSSGDVACAAYGEDTRVDAFASGFIAPMVARAAPGSAALGAVCLYDGNCAPGATCVAAEDDPAVRFCSVRCEGDGACPRPMRCDAGWCRYAAPTPTGFGSACERDDDCASDVCARAPDGSGACSRACWPGAVACSGAAACEASSSARAPYACVPTTELAATGGCRAARGAMPRGDLAFGVGLGLVLLARRRRSRAQGHGP